MIMGWGLQSKSKVKDIAGLGVPGGKNEGKVGTSEKAEKSPRAYKWGPERRDLHCLLPKLGVKRLPHSTNGSHRTSLPLTCIFSPLHS